MGRTSILVLRVQHDGESHGLQPVEYVHAKKRGFSPGVFLAIAAALRA